MISGKYNDHVVSKRSLKFCLVIVVELYKALKERQQPHYWQKSYRKNLAVEGNENLN